MKKNFFTIKLIMEMIIKNLFLQIDKYSANNYSS